MSHVAIYEALDGKPVEWLEKVSDEQYGKQPPSLRTAASISQLERLDHEREGG